jgi:hypothetical protein
VTTRPDPMVTVQVRVAADPPGMLRYGICRRSAVPRLAALYDREPRRSWPATARGRRPSSPAPTVHTAILGRCQWRRAD